MRSSLCSVLLTLLLIGAGVDVYAQSTDERVMTGVRFDGNTSVVSLVIPGGPADKAGIRVGDEIVSAGEKFVVQSSDLVTALEESKTGDTVQLEIRKGNQFVIFAVQVVQSVSGDVVIGDDGQVALADLKLGIVDELGPELTCDQWWGVPDGVNARLRENRGKVVCMFLFQADCRYSNQDGIPELKKLQRHFAEDDEVLLLAIQTPFQNFEYNTFENAAMLFEKAGLKGPLGHDGNQAGSSKSGKSKTFQNYKALGTPWFVVLDREGVVRYNNSSLPIDEAIVMFQQLKSIVLPDRTAKDLDSQQAGLPTKPESDPEDTAPDKATRSSSSDPSDWDRRDQ